jgi:hypothetical protein
VLDAIKVYNRPNTPMIGLLIGESFP